jgi:hypothetical protein
VGACGVVLCHGVNAEGTVNTLIEWRLVTSTNREPIRYRSEMGDAATFIAPAFLVAYLAVGCLLLWGRVG